MPTKKVVDEFYYRYIDGYIKDESTETEAKRIIAHIEKFVKKYIRLNQQASYGSADNRN